MYNPKLSNSRNNALKNFKDRFLNKVDQNKSISDLSKNDCLKYLKPYKEKASKTFNHELSSLSLYLKQLIELDHITTNYADGFKKEKVKPRRNKAFTKEQLNQIWDILENHPVLKFYCMHVYYGLMRPVTINRLKVKDVNLKDGIFETDTKTGKFIKIITSKLKDVYKTLDFSKKNKLIFGKGEFITNWKVSDNTKRAYYTKQFRKLVKEPLELNDDYGIYSLRHNGHVNFYHNYKKSLEANNEHNTHYKTCEAIMDFTNKKTIKEVETYLRDVDPSLRFDYGKFID